MIHVRMRQEHQIDWGQLAGSKRRCNQPLGANRSYTSIGSHSPEKDRIGQNGDTVEIQQNRCMTKPGGRDAIGVPKFGGRCVFGFENRPSRLGDELTDRPRS